MRIGCQEASPVTRPLGTTHHRRLKNLTALPGARRGTRPGPRGRRVLGTQLAPREGEPQL